LKTIQETQKVEEDAFFSNGHLNQKGKEKKKRHGKKEKKRHGLPFKTKKEKSIVK
jgi:hypothetical protein